MEETVAATAGVSVGRLVELMSYGMLGTAVFTFLPLVLGIRAPYGRYFEEGKLYGFLVNGRLAWIVQVGLSSRIG